MRKRTAFLEAYKQFPIFSDGLEEFDQAEECVVKLIEEYEAAEKEDYINWGASEDQRAGGGDAGMDYHQ